MKNNIVFWGEDEQNQKILVIVRLRADDNKIDIWTMSDRLLKQDLIDKMFGDWDDIDIKELPEGYIHIERDLSSTELLPENIKTDQTELIKMAEKEWYVKVLSARLFLMMHTEIEALYEQVMLLKEFDQGYWDSCRAYWDKIMTHVNERNLNRNQAKDLREKVNNSFERLKELKTLHNRQKEEECQANFFQLNKSLDNIAVKLKEKQPKSRLIFRDLKSLQKTMKEQQLSNSGRKQLWNRFNEMFRHTKSVLSQDNANRFENRITGLEKAIQRMQSSIGRDQADIDFQNKRSESARASQLEMQLREAKSQMIKARLESKKEKLTGMLVTMKELQDGLAKANVSSSPLQKGPKKKQEANEKIAETEAASKTEVKPKAKPEVKPEAKSEVKTETKAEVKPKINSKVKTEEKSEEKPKMISEEKLKAKSKVNSEAKSEEKPKGKSDVKTEEKPEVISEVKTETKAELKPKINSKVKTEEKPEMISEEKPKAKSKVNSEAKSEEKTKGKTNVKTEAKSEEKTEAKQEEKPKGKSKVKTDAKTEEKAEVKSKAKSEEQSVPKEEPTTAPEKIEKDAKVVTNESDRTSTDTEEKS